MKPFWLFALTALFPLSAAANCIPPWQTLFACNIPEKNARAEFCQISDGDSTARQGRKSAYYTYAVGSNVAELYFETDGYSFSTKDTEVDHPTDLTMGIGFTNKNYVYAFFVTEDKRLDGRIRDADIRVYTSENAFSSQERNTERLRLQCDPASIIANQDNIRP